MAQVTLPSKGHARCCIVGGGPAGITLGLLLARAGIDVAVFEKHADFLRDFRGDTIHPSTLEIMHELGLLEAFLKRPHSEIRYFNAQVGNESVPVADLSHLPTRCKFVAFMPQWDFLNFLATEAKRSPSFRLEMAAEVTDLIEEGDRITGVRLRDKSGERILKSDLVVAADGRHSTVRARAKLDGLDLGAPIDVLWLRLSKGKDDQAQVLGRIDNGRILVMLDRGDYWQCAFVIRKGGYDDMRRRGLAHLREEIARLAPFVRDRIEELADWGDVKLLTVRVDRLRRWYRPGLLCVGDAAHAMSPIGGVGINLAVQDAVAAANILVPDLLLGGAIATETLSRVQRRRELPTRLTQRMQLFVQDRVICRVLAGSGPMRVPLALRLLQRWPLLRRIPARIIGLGFRPEHVRTPALAGN